MTTRGSFDVVILGAGPAGCACAIHLRNKGFSVLLLERKDSEIHAIGETLLPDAIPQLHRLGIWDGFLADKHLPSPGILSLWNTNLPQQNDFLTNPHGHGWHLDRRKFNLRLRQTAMKKGASFENPVRLQHFRLDTNGIWWMQYSRGKEVLSVRAQFVVDGTGRSAWFARQQGAVRVAIDRLIAIIGVGKPRSDKDHRTYLEAVESGWWYGALIPNAQVVMTLMTDWDIVPRNRKALELYWRTSLEQTSIISRFLQQNTDLSSLRVVAAGSSSSRPSSGHRWLAIGDAAIAFDPLSSLGIYKAFESAEVAVEQIESELVEGLGKTIYEPWLKSEETAYWDNYRFYYQQDRWPDSVFWNRRRTK
jgi:flavin-dependent dehydrogenase